MTAWARLPPHTANNSKGKDSKRQKRSTATAWARLPVPHTANNSKGKDSKRQKSATGTVWARLPAPHTANNSKGKDSKRATIGNGLDYQCHTQPTIAKEKIARDKRAPLTWARLPAPHTANNSKGKDSRRDTAKAVPLAEERRGEQEAERD